MGAWDTLSMRQVQAVFEGIEMASRRSTLLFLGAAAGVVIAFQSAPKLLERFAGLPEFEPLDSLAGFRRISGGASSSAGFDPLFFGVSNDRNQSDEILEDQVRMAPCASLFGDGLRASGSVPIASFSEYYCPYCKVLMRRLNALAEELGDEINITWHEIPILGDNSVLAAKAALAAKRQGAYLAFQQSLFGPIVANAEYLKRLSERIGIDPERLMSDMNSADVARELAVTSAIYRVFGFVGTPALVVGRTAVQGEISDKMLRRLIAVERQDDWSRVC